MTIEEDTLHKRLSKLEVTTPYFAKDLRKAIGATKFIGRGSARSSTERYRRAAGDLANCGEYKQSDVVFVSCEGARAGRIEIDFDELRLAITAGATFVCDIAEDRQRPYNLGERTLMKFLLGSGYIESSPGRWTPAQQRLP